MDSMAYNAEQARRMQQRRKNLERRQQQGIEEKSKLLKNIESAEPLKLHPLTYHTPRLLSLEDVSVSYGSKEVFGSVSFQLRQGDRLALTGGNGSGKSSIVKLLCGEDIPHTGAVNIGGRLVISYVPQDASFLSGDLAGYAYEQGIDETLFKAILRKLDFSRVQFEKEMRDFSAGQKKKVLIARSLCQSAHLYIWDEPLNYIDVLSRMQIEELILAYRPTLLFVEHDRAFCDNVATGRVAL
jgi:lincosamide and streptogramin A transport system ATP-binding/permease protein